MVGKLHHHETTDFGEVVRWAFTALDCESSIASKIWQIISNDVNSNSHGKM